MIPSWPQSSLPFFCRSFMSCLPCFFVWVWRMPLTGTDDVIQPHLPSLSRPGHSTRRTGSQGAPGLGGGVCFAASNFQATSDEVSWAEEPRCPRGLQQHSDAVPRTYQLLALLEVPVHQLLFFCFFSLPPHRHLHEQTARVITSDDTPVRKER